MEKGSGVFLRDVKKDSRPLFLHELKSALALKHTAVVDLPTSIGAHCGLAKADQARTADHGGAVDATAPPRCARFRRRFPSRTGRPTRRSRRWSTGSRARRRSAASRRSATRTSSKRSISRNAAQRRLIDELLSFFGGRTQPVMAHLIESGQLTLDDVREAEQTLRKLAEKGRSRERSRQGCRTADRRTISGSRRCSSRLPRC